MKLLVVLVVVMAVDFGFAEWNPHGYTSDGYASTGRYYYGGVYVEKCGLDGLYYKDVYSFVICSNGNSYVQPCAPGTQNSGYQNYLAGSYYAYSHFCDVNLNDYANLAYPHPHAPVHSHGPAYPHIPLPNPHGVKTHPHGVADNRGYRAEAGYRAGDQAYAVKGESYHKEVSYEGEGYHADKAYPGESYHADKAYPSESYHADKAYPSESYHADKAYPGDRFQAKGYEGESYHAEKGYNADAGYQSEGRKYATQAKKTVKKTVVHRQRDVLKKSDKPYTPLH